MISWRLPGVICGVPFLVGTAAGLALGPRPLTSVALLALGSAWGRSTGRILMLGAIGLASGGLRPGPEGEPPPSLATGRPLEVRGVLETPWRRGRFGWSARLESSTVRQESAVTVWKTRLRVDLASGTHPPRATGVHRLKGFLGRAPALGNDPELAAGPWRLKVKSSRLIEVGEGSAGVTPAAPLYAARRRLESLLDSAPDTPGPRMARALVLGDGSRLDRDVLRGLRRAGLGHLLAVSGLHVGIAGALVWWLAAPLGERLRGFAPVAAAAGYLLLVGLRPAILRAAAMALLAARSLTLQRVPEGVNSLAWALAVILALDPAAASDLGFRLTAAATLGIVVLGPLLAARWHWLPRGLSRALAASVGAQLGSLPWTLSAFHLTTPLTSLLNLAAIPWTALTLAVSLVAVALVAAVPSAAEAAWPVLDLLAAPYGWWQQPPPGRLAILSSGLGLWTSTVVAGGLGYSLVGRGVARRLAALLLAALVFFSAGKRPAVEVVMIDVGQGDAILIRDGRATALVDGGGWRQRDIAQQVLLPTLARLGVRRLDAVVLTHADLDHCRGLVEVMAYLPVAEVWSARGLGAGGCGADLLGLSGPRWRPLWRGREASLGRWRIETLHPGPGGRGAGNDASLVLRASLGGRAILLTGDLGTAGERELLKRVDPAGLRAAVLKVAHHGSRSSTSRRLLDAVSPRLALISAGRGNAYGHPSPVVLERLADRGIHVLRTDRDGMIRLPWPAGTGLNSPGAPSHRDRRSDGDR